MNNNFFMSDVTKENIKSRFNDLHGVYTKTIDNNKVISYIARCECKNSDYITVVHYIVDGNKNENDKYISMSSCIEKGDRYIKWLEKSYSCMPHGIVTCGFNKQTKEFLDSDLYQNKIKEYEEKFIKRISKYYKIPKNVLIFYI